jgi:guanyl-specific ribonuclease Sa
MRRNLKTVWLKKTSAFLILLFLLGTLSGCLGWINTAETLTEPYPAGATTLFQTTATSRGATGSLPDILTPRPTAAVSSSAATTAPTSEEEKPDLLGRYSTPEDVAAYLQVYGRLPDNYLTKQEAAELGWEASLGNLWKVTDQMSIGGDRFGNREGLLPDAEGRIWYECDVNYQGGFRGAERLVFSNDGLIYYSDDHYQSFRRLY